MAWRKYLHLASSENSDANRETNSADSYGDLCRQPRFFVRCRDFAWRRAQGDAPRPCASRPSTGRVRPTTRQPRPVDHASYPTRPARSPRPASLCRSGGRGLGRERQNESGREHEPPSVRSFFTIFLSRGKSAPTTTNQQPYEFTSRRARQERKPGVPGALGRRCRDGHGLPRFFCGVAALPLSLVSILQH